MAQQNMQNMPNMQNMQNMPPVQTAGVEWETHQQSGPLLDEMGYAMPAELSTYPRDEWMSGEVEGLPGPGMGAGPGARQPGTSSAAYQRSRRMQNPVDMAGTHSPADGRQAYHASLRSLLSRNVGYYIICTFLVGTQGSVTWQGILHTVGSDYLVLYQPNYDRYISCDLYSLKFAQFHDTRSTPYCAGSQSWQGKNGDF